MTLKTTCLTAIILVVAACWARSQQVLRFAVHFPYDAAQPALREHKRLDSLVKILPPGTQLTLTGHTDSVASVAYNERLSRHRTEWVKSYLIQKGIPEKQLACNWRGESLPLRTDGSKASHALNRRVEISWSQAPQASRSNISDFYFDADRGLDTLTADQVHIVIPPRTLQNKQGAYVQGWVHVRFHNFKDRIDQMQAGMSLDFEDKGNWYLYNSAGMFGIWALQGNDTLSLQHGSKLRIEYPLRKTDLDLSFFKYIGVTGRWSVEAKPSEAVNTTPKPANPTESTPSTAEEPARAETPAAATGVKPAEPAEVIDPTTIVNIAPPKKLNTLDDQDSVDIVPPDTLKARRRFYRAKIVTIKVKTKPVTCQSCYCKPATYIHHLTSCISLKPLSASDLDLRFYYLGYSAPYEIEQYFCRPLQFNWISINSRRPAKVMIVPSFRPDSLPARVPGIWKIRSGLLKRSPVMKGRVSDDIVFHRKEGTLRFELEVKQDTVTKVYHGRYLSDLGKNATLEDQINQFDQTWAAYLANATKRTSVLDSNLRRFVSGERHCDLALSADDLKYTNPMAWLRSYQKPLERNSRIFLEKCAPNGCCDDPPIVRPDSIQIDSSKVMLIEDGAIPIVLLDDFGLFNWDAIESLPNPTWINTRFLDSNGQPINAERFYLLVGEINGVIRMPWSTLRVRISPAMRNQFVLMDVSGAIHYCTAAVFSAALQQGGQVITVPCVTVPHKVGDPPLDLRAVLPFD
jgi:OmpA family